LAPASRNLSSNDKGTGGQDNNFQDVSVGIDYELAPGLILFVEYTWYEINPGNFSIADIAKQGQRCNRQF
jgi:predicted porin